MMSPATVRPRHGEVMPENTVSKAVAWFKKQLEHKYMALSKTTKPALQIETESAL